MLQVMGTLQHGPDQGEGVGAALGGKVGRPIGQGILGLPPGEDRPFPPLGASQVIGQEIHRPVAQLAEGGRIISRAKGVQLCV